jgi:hypothetical protein
MIVFDIRKTLNNYNILIYEKYIDLDCFTMLSIMENNCVYKALL